MLKKSLEKKYNNFIIISVPAGLGETTLTCLMIKQLKKKYERKVAIVVKDKKTLNYVSHFKDIDKVISTSKSFISFMNSQKYLYSEMIPGKIYNPKKGLQILLPNKDPQNFFERYKICMNLCGNYEYSKLFIDKKRLYYLKNKYQLQNKSILLCPQSISLNDTLLKPHFWNTLAIKLKKMGYTIFINSNEYVFGKTGNYIFKSIYDTILIASMVNYVIAFRSGLLDTFAANINTKMLVFYPTTDFQVFKYKKQNDSILSKKIINEFSLFNMYKTKNISEISITKNNIGNLENLVLNKIV